jgi:hypothetical protein
LRPIRASDRVAGRAAAWLGRRIFAWINFSGMGESDDFCHSSPKCAKLIHAAGGRRQVTGD